MRRTLTIIGVLLVLAGGIFTLQGLNILLGSFMSGSTQWLYIGLAMVLVGAVVLVGENLKRK